MTKFLWTMLIISVCCNVFLVGYLQETVDGLVENRCELYNARTELYEKKPLINGIYWKNTDFYCVWAKDRPLDSIEKTDRHEYCHYLIDNDYEHFCR